MERELLAKQHSLAGGGDGGLILRYFKTCNCLLFSFRTRRAQSMKIDHQNIVDEN